MPDCDAVDNLFDKISKTDTSEHLEYSEDGEPLTAQNQVNPTKLGVPAPPPQKDHFLKHLPLSQLNIGIKNGKFIQGKINIKSENSSVGNILSDKHGTILVQGLQNLNRAVDSDQVAIKLLDEKDWIHEIEEYNDLKSGAAPTETNPAPKNGTVVGVIKRNWRQYAGMLDPESATGRKVLFLPADSKIPKIEIETRQLDKLINNRIVVSIDSWPRTSKYPLGHFIRSLGKIGDKTTEKEVVLLEHEVPHEAFTDAVLKCLPKEGLKWKFDPKKHMSLGAEGTGAEREDLRALPVCSVDPPGCTDIDDTLHCIDVPGRPGFSEVGVHIADVSHFIKPGTAIDEEARNRGTTVYLCDDRIDIVCF